MTIKSLEALCARKLANKISDLEKDENFPKVVWKKLCEKAYTREEFLALDDCEKITLWYCLDVYSDDVDWNGISFNQILSEEFIEKFTYKVNWYNISGWQNLSEQFIEKFADKINWYIISQSQTLSEQFIEKFTDNLDWYNISRCQTLSKSFIKKTCRCRSNKIRFWLEI